MFLKNEGQLLFSYNRTRKGGFFDEGILEHDSGGIYDGRGMAGIFSGRM